MVTTIRNDYYGIRMATTIRNDYYGIKDIKFYKIGTISKLSHDTG